MYKLLDEINQGKGMQESLAAEESILSKCAPLKLRGNSKTSKKLIFRREAVAK